MALSLGAAIFLYGKMMRVIEDKFDITWDEVRDYSTVCR